jgi:uncharacterized membrane protein YgdD (TMEM256/DUF423 family)
MARLFLLMGTAFAGLAVAGGAFASHALKKSFSESALAIFETGVRYQMYHALALILVGILALREETKAIAGAGWAFSLGILLFSGSLYALSLSGIKIFGVITPLGGLAFLLGWISLAIAAWTIS